MAAKDNIDIDSSTNSPAEVLSGNEAFELPKPDIILKEWSPLTHLLNKIPLKAQKGFTTLDLSLTCIAALPEFLVLGTNVGLLYWYNRKTGSLERLKIEHPTNPVTCLSVVSSVDYMLAAGNKDGIITIFQIPKHFDEKLIEMKGNVETKIPKKKEVQIFSVKDMHRSPITALEWSANGIKLFSGDAAGVVTLTEMDYVLGQSKSTPLLDEKFEIVQLSYSLLNLVISTTFRTIVYATDSKQSTKIGSQDRKVMGHFGAVLAQSFNNRDRKVYTARPGLRIWVAGLDGTVQSTIIFKDLLANPHLNIPVINPWTGKTIPSTADAQFGTLLNFSGKYLLSWHKENLYILDPEHFEVVGSCSELKSIVSVAVCQNEIFVLETGRNVIRISGHPDPLQSSLPSGNDISSPPIIPDIMTTSLGDFRIPDKPLNFIASKLKETSRALPKFNGSILHTIKNVIEADLEIQDGQFTVLPLVVPLKEGNIPNITIQTTTPTPTKEELAKAAEAAEKERERFDRISKQSFEDVVLAQGGGRKGGKKKRVAKEKEGIISDSTSLSSHYSSNSEGDSNGNGGTGTVTPAAPSTLTVAPTKRKSSTDSSGSISATSSSEQHSPDEYIPGLANVRFYNDNALNAADLETKEQMLAKLLNWTDLLPQPAPGALESSTNSSSNGTLDIPHGGGGRGSEPSSIKTLTSEDVDSGMVDMGSSNGTVRSGSPNPESGSEENEHENENEDNVSHSSSTYDSSVDIYKRYGPHGGSYGHGQGDTLSINSSNFSFGPPSGSSNMYYTTEGSQTSSLCGSTTEEYRRDLGIVLGGMDEHEPGELIESSLVHLGLNEIEDMEVEGNVGNDQWVQFKLPTPIAAISSCDRFVVLVDSQNAVFYSSLTATTSNTLRWVKADYKANQVALSPSGSIVWRIDTKRVLYSLTFPSTEGPTTVEGEWVQLLENVKFVALEESVAWIVKTDGSVHVCKRIKDGIPIPKPAFEPVPTNWVVTQLTTLKNYVWALTSDGRILYRSRVSVVSPLGEEWVEVKLITTIPPISAFGVGPNESLWMVDVQNKLHFMSGKHLGLGEERQVWDVLIADYIFQHQQQRPSCGKHWKLRLVDSLRPANLASFLQAKVLPLLCASSSSVWFTLSGTTSIYVNRKGVKGHRWEPFNVHCGMRPMKWTEMYASSIYCNHGFLWLMNCKKKLYYCNPNDKKLQPLELFGGYCRYGDPVHHVASAPEALWVLTSKGNIYGRCNMNSKNDLGSGWERIQLSPLENVRLIHVSIGSEVAWACDSKGSIYMRLGSLDPPGVNDISPAWVKVDARASNHQGAAFTKVYVGTSGLMVWALDAGNNVYAREAVFPDLPIGTDWVHVSGIEATSLAISDYAVWALSPKGEIFRRHGISKTNFVGEYWRKIPGTAQAITASLCDGIWALDACGYLQKHFTETQEFTSGKNNSINDSAGTPTSTCSPKTVDGEDNENDWEFIG